MEIRLLGWELKQLQGVEIPLLRHQSGKLQAARFGISGPIGPILAPLLEAPPSMAHSSLIITNYSNFAGHSPGFQTSFPLSLSLCLSRNLRIIHFSFLADSSFETRDCPSLSPFEYLFHRKLKQLGLSCSSLSFSFSFQNPSLFSVFFPPEM